MPTVEGLQHELGWMMCGATAKHSGKPCKKPAGWNTDHLGYGNCSLHGGVGVKGKVFADKQMARMEMESMLVDLPQVDPKEALLMCVRIAAAEVSYYTWRISNEEEIVAEMKEQHATASGRVVETTVSGVTMWIGMREEATARLARFSKMALDARIDERLVDGANALGEKLSRLLRGILDDLELTAEQIQRAPIIVSKHLQIMEASTPGVPA